MSAERMSGDVPAGRSRAWGAQVQPGGGVWFRLWAPACESVALRIEGAAADQPMARAADGWFDLVTAEAGHGSRYWFVLPDGRPVPDPASCHQPADVAGPSEVIDPARFAWTDGGWRGRPWSEAVVYELHVGAFSAQGGFAGVRERLPHLVALGVTALEIMPVADFPGARNWGYDGVFPYAPDATYGRPEDLKALVDAAHAAGLMVLLDVVYNHFGPQGNYLGVYAPQFFTDRHQTPWGAGINFDGPHAAPVRRFFIDNALYWLGEFHLDGLRLDAVHAIRDDSTPDIIAEIAQQVRTRGFGRPIHLVLENEDNESRRLLRAADGTVSCYTAQWNDDLHHVLHTAATGERSGYYADYHGDSSRLARALAEGFAFQGELMPYRGRPRGEPSASLPPTAFVGFIQNHDQIGNRAFGERLAAIAPPEAVRAVAAVYLLLPQIPMLFMGEEWDARNPFPFFCDFQGDLAQAVREGRRAEFARFPEFQDPARREQIPDPLAAATFDSARLDWRQLQRPPHGAALEWYRSILAVRAREIAPRLPQLRGDCVQQEILAELAVRIRWRLGAGGSLTLLANLTDRSLPADAAPQGRVLWREGRWQSGGIPAWGVCWTFDDSA